MGITLTALSGTHDASTLRARLTTIEEYLNGGIVQGDYASSQWAESFHLFRPDLKYPSWVDMPSCSVWWAEKGISRQRMSIHHAYQAPDQWQPIRGAARTIVIAEDSRTVNIMASLYAYQEGGAEYNKGAGTAPANDDETLQVATFALFVNGNQVSSTERFLYARGTDLQYCRKQFVWTKQTTLSTGIKDIAIKVKLTSANLFPTGSTYNRVLVDCRNLVVDAQYR